MLLTVEVSLDEETRVNSSISFSVCAAKQNLSNLSTSVLLNNNSSFKEFSNKTSPKEYKSLDDINTSCQFALTIPDPLSYEEATEKEDGQKAIV